MKITILCAVILSAATATADTTIIEYSDHYVVESAVTPDATAALSRESSTPAASAAPDAYPEVSASPPAKPTPVSNFGSTYQPVAPAERWAAMNRKIQQLQQERGELMAPREGDSPDQAALRQQEAAGKLKKINKMSSELLKISVQGNEHSSFNR
jgi:hypothetical protein